MQVTEVDKFFYGDVADFIFFNNAIIVPNQVDVFYVQDVTHATVTSVNAQPFVGLNGQSLVVSSDTSPPVTITFDRDYYTVRCLVDAINDTVGVSGFKACEHYGFVILSSNTLGSASTLTVVSAPSALFQVGTYHGTDQAHISVSVAAQLSQVSPGMYAVSFPIDSTFETERSYYVQIMMNNIWDTNIKKFSVFNKNCYVTENFVSEE